MVSDVVKLNGFPRLWEECDVDVLQAVERVGRSGWYILGQEVSRFEQALAVTWGTRFAVGVGNGMDAIEIALRASGLQRGARVLTTPLSAFATTLAILRAGGTPLFCDVDSCGLIDLNRCYDLLRAEPDIAALLPVHLYGFPVNVSRLEALKNEFNIILVEDCAQAIGAKSFGRPVGVAGNAAAVSFYPTKNLGALGDGGALLTADPEIASLGKALRHYGQRGVYKHDLIGLNSRLDELQAAILLTAFLPRLTSWSEKRRSVATYYRSHITNPSLTIPNPPEGSEPVWHLFPVLVPHGQRDSFRAHLESLGIQSAVHYPRLITEQNALEGIVKAGKFENAQRFAQCEVSLPIHPFLTREDLHRVVAACNSWKRAKCSHL